MSIYRSGRSLRSAVAWLVATSLAFPVLPAQAGPMDMGGQFAVNESGAATYTVPIQVPPGTGGMEPKLALSYNSQSGNGLLGVGWNLSGLSAITRCPRTMAQDGVRGGVNFDANDRFCMDGQRLMVVSGTYGTDGTEYRTERESFSKIISYGIAGSGPAWFKVWTKAGQILEYGNTADSRIEAQGKSSARVWAINKVSDTVGNYMTFSYAEDSANGDYYPSHIDYTGNTNTGLSPNNSVQFIYEARSDVEQMYLAGSLIKNSVRLKILQTWANSIKTQEHRITYSTSTVTNRSAVTVIAECDGANACKPGVSISSSGAPTDFSGNSHIFPNGWNFGYPVQFQLITGDFNGDGKTDFVEIASNYYYTSLSNGDGTFTGNSHILPNGWNFGYPVQFQLISGDFNGDGKTDFVEVASNYYYTMLSNGDGTFTGNSHILPNGWNFGYPVQFQLIAGDFNGDGNTDFVEAANNTYYTLLSNGDGTFTGNSHILPNGWNFGYPVQFQLITGDFNGDGKTDFVEIASNYYYTSLSNGDGTFTGNSHILPNGWNFGYPVQFQLIAGDFNGDGKTDFVELAGNTYYTLLSNGDGAFTGNSHILPSGWNFGPVQFQLITGDFNGDGKADFVEIASNYYYTMLSNGDGTFTGNSHVLPNGWNFGYPVQFQLVQGDFNGDGKTDFVEIASNTYYPLLSNAVIPDLAIAFRRPMGAATSISYGALTNSAIYTKGTGSIYPLMDLQSPMYAVSQVQSSNGVGGVLTTNYTYGGLRAEVGTGRGLLGFAWQQATSPDTGISVRTDYRQDWPYVGLPSKVTKTQTSAVGPNKQLSIVTQTYACQNPASGSPCTVAAGNRYFPYLSQSVENNWDLNGTALPTATTTNSYDSYGNATQVSVSTSDGYSKTTTNTYTNDSTNWYLGRLTRSQVQSTTP